MDRLAFLWRSVAFSWYFVICCFVVLGFLAFSMPRMIVQNSQGDVDYLTGVVGFPFWGMMSGFCFLTAYRIWRNGRDSNERYL